MHTTMLKEERHQEILDMIKQSSKVLSSELSIELNVSEDTIRRDLKELSQKGLIRKVHGGAVLNDSSAYIPMNYDDRKTFAFEEKKIIAQKAISLLKDDMLIFIDGGTTNQEIASQLPNDINISVMTNCLPVAIELLNKPNIQTHFLGGRILSGVPITVGADTINILNEVNADIFFIGTRSFSIEKGLTDIDRTEVLVKRKMAERSALVVSVALSEKLGSVQSFNIIPTEKLNYLITELNPEDQSLINYKSLAGLTLL
ncbi:DeoR/GlpR family DNA-binding transcription regulator [Saccharicrinis aurantiacus]|uniref:DeoR/GlpR family DNA-binding transcription regulator n=1 Tax=Saccharicrinis aurantiacus TaxID=1849719 RepID=UPI001C9E36A0|nr:DeoR/GlpR family DNA-binding transcription regulator [Saccharicrinis aurantiacus]